VIRSKLSFLLGNIKIFLAGATRKQNRCSKVATIVNLSNRCPNSNKVLQKAGCQSIEEHIQKRRETIMEHGKTRNTHEKCKNSEIASKKTYAGGKLIIIVMTLQRLTRARPSVD
jgi:hypothetical protein